MVGERERRTDRLGMRDGMGIRYNGDTPWACPKKGRESNETTGRGAPVRERSEGYTNVEITLNVR